MPASMANPVEDASTTVGTSSRNISIGVEACRFTDDHAKSKTALLRDRNLNSKH